MGKKAEGLQGEAPQRIRGRFSRQQPVHPGQVGRSMQDGGGVYSGTRKVAPGDPADPIDELNDQLLP